MEKAVGRGVVHKYNHAPTQLGVRNNQGTVRCFFRRHFGGNLGGAGTGGKYRHNLRYREPPKSFPPKNPIPLPVYEVPPNLKTAGGSTAEFRGPASRLKNTAVF